MVEFLLLLRRKIDLAAKSISFIPPSAGQLPQTLLQKERIFSDAQTKRSQTKHPKTKHPKTKGHTDKMSQEKRRPQTDKMFGIRHWKALANTNL